MKKLTLTFCALSALFIVAPALYADDGPEAVSSKEKQVMQPAPPACDFYRAHEWDLGIWAAYAFASDTGQFNVPNDDPFSPDEDVTNVEFFASFGVGVSSFKTTVVKPKSGNPRERINLGQVSKNELFGRDNTFGGGVDVKYFWNRYFGVGLEGLGLAAKTNFAGGGLVTLTFRYPFGRFAPYAMGGLGFIDGGATLFKFFNEKNVFDANGNAIGGSHEFFTVDPVSNHHVRALGQLGAGLEFRVTCHIGLMADVSWNFVFGQEDHADKFKTVIEQGTDTTFEHFCNLGVCTDIPLSSTIIINTATNLQPGHGSDHQDFGLARFGVTFSY